MIRTAIVVASLALLATTSTSFAKQYGGYQPSYGHSSYSSLDATAVKLAGIYRGR